MKKYSLSPSNKQNKIKNKGPKKVKKNFAPLLSLSILKKKNSKSAISKLHYAIPLVKPLILPANSLK